jgi:(2R)-3-sulfolactate dehydrogenase (NADP+)
MPTLNSSALVTLATNALTRAGASPAMARSAAMALVAADEQGISSHGVSRIPFYTAHLRNHRIVGDATPCVIAQRGGACLIDAGNGMAYPACELAIQELITRAREFGVVYVGITNSNHFGMTSLHLEPLAAAGLVSLAFGNAPAAINAWGGTKPLFGTNPLAAGFPRKAAWPLIVDLSLSHVAKGKLMLAKQRGELIPLGWALDKNGKPTTDPNEGLQGSMVATGGVKGTMLAMTIELLAVALTGAAFGFEADSFFSDTGNMARIGQGFLAIDPGALAGHATYHERIETLVTTMLQDPDVRLPAYRRFENRDRSQRDGIVIDDGVFQTLTALANA